MNYNTVHSYGYFLEMGNWNETGSLLTSGKDSCHIHVLHGNKLMYPRQDQNIVNYWYQFIMSSCHN
jgi:hypothetical protein